MAGSSEHILLDAYAAKRCPVRVQNAYSPLAPTLEWTPAPEIQARLDAGLAFERKVFEELSALHPAAVTVDPHLAKVDAIAATVEAMESGAPLVLGGWLPDDAAGGRKGRPDLLIRVAGCYLPADVKHHATVEPRKTTTAVMSALASPDARCEVSGWTATSHRYEDGMQLAHYTRMLQACGHHPGPELLWGAVLGISAVAVTGADHAGLVLIWHDLHEPLFWTFSRSQGKTRRSLLERYDHEQSFRVKVAENACRITGSDDDPAPLVELIGQDECGTCPYERWCAEQMGSEDPSAAITIGRLGVREWLTLRGMGITTTEALSTVDPDDPTFFDEYVVEVSHLSAEVARKRARYISDFTDWEPLDEQAERALAARFAAWLRAQRTAAEAAGETLRVFHWSHPEWSKLHSILGADEVDDLTNPEDGVFTDVEKVFKAHFTALRGSGIKKVAPLFGFRWRVDDPGGAVSQTYLATVHTATDANDVAAAKHWLLSYNEDDAAAMAAIRDGLRRWRSVTT